MAIDINKQELLKEMTTLKSEWNSTEIQDRLSVSSSWVSKNSAELGLYGICLQRKQHKPHKPHKQHSGKGLARDTNQRLDYSLLTFTGDWHIGNYLQIRFLVNQFHMKLSIPVPFVIENKEYSTDTVTPEDYKILEDSYKEWEKDKSIHDIYLFLKDLKQSILTSDKTYNKTAAKRVFIHMFNIIESYPYIALIEKDPVLLLQVRSAFKEVHNFEPTDEQIQVIAKAYKFATGAYDGHKVASIQADAGSSKTTCALVIQHMLYEQIPYITAITNKALNNIKNSKTVSSLLNCYADIEIADNYKIKLIKAKANAGRIPFIIVDESSQCGMKTRILLETISDKVLYMGDQEQLPAIMDDQGVDFLYLHTLSTQYRFLDTEDTFQIEYSKLNKHKLYSRADELIQDKIIGSVQPSSRFKEVKESSVGVERYSDFTGSFSKYTELLKTYNPDSHLIITYAQGAVDEINKIVNEGDEIKVNSKVMLVTNQYAVEQFNGFIYRVLQIENNRALCKSIDTGKEFWYKTKDLVLSYAVTTMKIQGSQIEHVLGIIDTMKPLANLDRYVITTRSSKTIRFLQCVTATQDQELVIQDKPDSFSINSVINKLKESQEGSRNNTLYGCAKDLIKLNATDDDFKELTLVAKTIGLNGTEIQTTIDSAKAIPTESIKTKKSGTSKGSLILEDFQTNPNLRLTQYFTPVFKNHKTLLGKDRILSKEEALAYPYILYIAEELKGGDRIVIDCDSKETVELFSEYLSQTESYVSTDKSSAHLVFTTDKLIRSSHKEGIDLLGNTLYTLRNIKDNKVYNDLKAIPLTQEILDLYENL